MRVKIEELPGGQFKLVGFGLATCGISFPVTEVIDVELLARPKKGGGSTFTLQHYFGNLGLKRGSSAMSPADLVESFKERFGGGGEGE